jgi:hypothetical protein
VRKFDDRHEGQLTEMSPLSDKQSRNEHLEIDLQTVKDLNRRLEAYRRAGLAIALGVLALYIFRFHGPLTTTQDVWGQFGDYVGGLLNPVFSFLALLALLATFRLQVQELEFSKLALQNSAAALEEQSETLHQQAFDATFFQLLRLHDDSILSLKDGTASGSACFETWRGEFEQELIRFCVTDINDTFITVHKSLFQNNPALEHYFRSLITLFDLLDRSSNVEREFYVRIVRNQLSDGEAKVIYYYCLYGIGKDRLKLLVEKYALLEYAYFTSEPAPAFYNYYQASAFGGRYPLNNAG